VATEAQPVGGFQQVELSNELASQWRRLTRAATAVALLTAPAVVVWLNQTQGWSWFWSILAALALVVCFRGVIDILFHRLIPRPSLFGLESQQLREEDVVARRRVWFWRFWVKAAIVIAVIVLPFYLFLDAALLVQIVPLLVILPFWSNFLIRVYAWMIILGPESAFTRATNALIAPLGFDPVAPLFSSFAVLVGLVYVHLPFMVLPLYANLEKHDPALLDAAQDLGAGAWHRFWRVTFPLSLPGVWAGAALVFIPALGIFAIPDILGGTSDTLIGNLIKQQFLETRDWPFGSVLSIVLTIVALLLAGLAAWVARPRRSA